MNLEAKAQTVLGVLPKAPYELICTAKEAELIKYGGNNLLAIKVLYMNMLYDLAEKLGCDWRILSEAMAHDERLGNSHWQPVHSSSPGMPAGRGFGGHCFIKDFAAFREMYEDLGDKEGLMVLDAITKRNMKYLLDSGKDLDILEGVYGKDVKIKNS